MPAWVHLSKTAWECGRKIIGEAAGWHFEGLQRGDSEIKEVLVVVKGADEESLP